MHNNINGGGGRGQVMSSVDFYRRVPNSLSEATALGAGMSICVMLIMGVLFFSETAAFFSTKIATGITLDENTTPQIRLNFNITLTELQCDFVSLNVWDSLGTNRQNVTKNVDKRQLDGSGTRRTRSSRNWDQRELVHDEHDISVAEMHETDGVHATELTKENFKEWLEENPMAFVDLFAPWCVWCQRLAPTWETFAQEVKKEGMPVGVGTIDCVKQADLCREQRTMAFPTLRWYHDGEAVKPDYKMDRTVTAFTGFAKHKLKMDEKFKAWNENAGNVPDKERETKPKLFQQNRPEHPACQVSGHLMVNRVPGNFYIEARSKNHNLNAAMTNLSHTVNHFSFGDPMDGQNYKSKRMLKQVPAEHRQLAPMNAKVFNTDAYHQAFHHYIKVVSTHLNMGNNEAFSMMTYPFLEQSQIVYYDEEDVPEARFSYDLSPMSVVVEKKGRKWHDYLTSLCANIGGTLPRSA